METVETVESGQETGWVGREGMFGSVIGTSTDDYSLSHSFDDDW